MENIIMETRLTCDFRLTNYTSDFQPFLLCSRVEPD